MNWDFLFQLLVNGIIVGKNLYLAFPLDGEWYLVAHDEIVNHFEAETPYLNTASWLENGSYHSGKPNQVTRAWLEDYRL